MSVNISVSGNSLKECHEQILNLAAEIRGQTVDEKTGPVPSLTQQGATPVNNAMKFPIAPEVASPSTTHVGQGPNLSAVPSTSHSTEAVDSRGLPWDARIHSSNKEQGKDAVWRRRRGVSLEVEAQVEAELRGQAPAPTKQAPPFGSMSPEQYKAVVQPTPSMPTTEHRVALPQESNVLNQVQAPPAPAAPQFAPPVMPQVLPPNSHNAESFRQNLITILNNLVVEGKLPPTWVQENRAMFGGKDVTQWHENQEQCNALFEAFVQWKFVNKI